MTTFIDDTYHMYGEFIRGYIIECPGCGRVFIGRKDQLVCGDTCRKRVQRGRPLTREEQDK